MTTWISARSSLPSLTSWTSSGTQPPIRPAPSNPARTSMRTWLGVSDWSPGADAAVLTPPSRRVASIANTSTVRIGQTLPRDACQCSNLRAIEQPTVPLLTHLFPKCSPALSVHFWVTCTETLMPGASAADTCDGDDAARPDKQAPGTSGTATGRA